MSIKRLAKSLLPSAKNPYYKGKPGDHFDGVRFFNPDGVPPANFSDLMKWQFNGQRSKWPKNFPSPFHGTKPEVAVSGKDIRITHIGHATFLIQTNGLNILTDPVWSDRASPIAFAGPKRVNPPAVEMADLPEIDAILLTHNHYDHLDIKCLKRLVAAHNPKILTPLGNDVLVGKSVPQADIVAADWGDTRQLPNGTVIHFEPCHHWGARSMSDRRMTLWCAFTIETPHAKIHHIGDTGFHRGINFRKSAEKHGAFDIAILPIGAYEPRWFMQHQHMNPDEAVETFKLLNAKAAIGHHWGTFQLTDEPLEEPAEKLQIALAKAGIHPEAFIASRPGQVWSNRRT